jgi:hypothetical protein
MKRKRIAIMSLAAVLAVIAGAASSYLLLQNFLVFEAHEVRMDITVVDGILMGVNTDTDALHFSKIVRGSEGLRNITLDNGDIRPHLVQIKTFGNISGFIYVSENSFVMGPHTRKNVTVTAKVPADAQLGRYEGTLQAIFINMIPAGG